MYFIHPTEEQLFRALQAWRWIGIEGKRPFLVTAFADVFFEAADGVYFLDTLEGTFTRVCQTADELTVLLGRPEGANHYLFAGFVERAQREGMVPQEGQCYDFKASPATGAPPDFSNVCVSNFVEAVSLAGQLHQQLRAQAQGAQQ